MLVLMALMRPHNLLEVKPTHSVHTAIKRWWAHVKNQVSPPPACGPESGVAVRVLIMKHTEFQLVDFDF